MGPLGRRSGGAQDVPCTMHGSVRGRETRVQHRVARWSSRRLIHFPSARPCNVLPMARLLVAVLERVRREVANLCKRVLEVTIECRGDVYCSHGRTVISEITLTEAVAQFLQRNVCGRKTRLAKSWGLTRVSRGANARSFVGQECVQRGATKAATEGTRCLKVPRPTPDELRSSFISTKCRLSILA
jgi:hypothetical protein